MLARNAFGRLPETPSQTAGPYVHIGLTPRLAGIETSSPHFGEAMRSAATRGLPIRIEGRIFDGTGTPVRDAIVELWQANADGCYAHPADRQGRPADPTFSGFGRAATDFDTGLYAFETILPGAVTGRSGHRQMAPHVTLWIVARGINIGLSTRMYFSDHEVANATDPVLRLIEQPARRATLIGRREDRGGQVVYVHDIRLQGGVHGPETVFFDV